MKRMILTLAVFAAATLSLMAIPAYPGRIPFRQSDGSIVYVRQHGDEWYHYTTDDSGRCVKVGEDGFLHETARPTWAEYESASRLRNQAYRPSGAWTPRTDMTIGERHIPVFLVEFQNKSFLSSTPADDFYKLMNERGYSYGGACGSVRDYYEDNSGGLFKPIFDVYGPVLVSGNAEDYGGQNYAVLACGCFWEVCKKLSDDGTVDFSQYDSNNDGKVDMMLFFFAGFNQADGGGVYNVDTIWPHQWHIQYGSSEARTTKLNGVYLDRYFCTSELQGYSGTRRCGIGTTCHEFGHSLGLPDFYDTDYELNGEAGALYQFSLMCSGGRLNYGNNPPRLNIEECRMLGWLEEEPAEISASGEYSLQPISTRKGYTLSTSTDGEYFLLESRPKTGWDAYLPNEGLLVYHIDKSSRSISFLNKSGRTITSTAQRLWDEWESYNSINVLGSHPLFHLVPAANQASLNYSDESKIPFPGAALVRTYLPTDWDGEDNRFKLSKIALNNGVCSFTVSGGAVPGVYGKVMNSSAQPIKNAAVVISSASPKQQINSSVTDIDGSFNFELDGYEPGDYILDVSCSGYESESVTITLPRKPVEHNIYLLAQGETLSGDLQRYTGTGTIYLYGSTAANQAMAICFSAEELGIFQGKQLRSISFRATKSRNDVMQTGEFYVFLEVDGERIFTQKVENPNLGSWTTVNVTSHGYVIDNPGETFIGYGIVDNSIQYPMYIETCSSSAYGYWSGNFSTTDAGSWSALSWSSSSENYTPLISAKLGDPVGPDLGFHYINNPGNGVYSAGDRFELTLVRSDYDEEISSVNWYYDGSYVSASSLSLTAGKHDIQAKLWLKNGGSNTLTLTIQVN